MTVSVSKEPFFYWNNTPLVTQFKYILYNSLELLTLLSYHYPTHFFVCFSHRFETTFDPCLFILIFEYFLYTFLVPLDGGSLLR